MRRFLPRVAGALAALFLLPQTALAADFVWATETTKATRFADSASKEVGEVEAGGRVELVFTDGERLRVRVKGATFGWIDKAKTTDTEPPADAPEETGGSTAPE